LTVRRRLSRAASLSALCLVMLSLPARAAPTGADARPSANAPARSEALVEVRVLHGTHERRDGDPRVSSMPELREGPFKSYASYTLLSTTQLALTRGAKRHLKLPNGRLLEARLEEILSDGSARLVARIDRPGGKEFLPLLEVKARPGQAFIVAGQSYQRGILVLVIKVLR